MPHDETASARLYKIKMTMPVIDVTFYAVILDGVVREWTKQKVKATPLTMQVAQQIVSTFGTAPDCVVDIVPML